VRSLLVIALLAVALPAFAGDAPFFRGDVQSRPVKKGLPEAVKNVGIDQHLGDQVTLDVPVRDENGAATTLGSYFGKRPVILVMAYYECPNLCTMVMNGVMASVKTLSFVPGKDYEVVSVSINPNEKSELAKKKKTAYVEGYHQSEHADGFHFLTAGQPTIDQLTKQVGFRYSYDTESQQYAHASGIMVLTPDGKISRYFFGVEYAPKDLKYGLMDASNGKIGSIADKLLLFCYHYDPASTKYGVAIANLLKIGGGLTIIGMSLMLFFLRRRSKMQAQLQISNRMIDHAF